MRTALDARYDFKAVRREMRRRWISPTISRKSVPIILRYIVEQGEALLDQFKRLAVRWEQRLELHDVLRLVRLHPRLLVLSPSTPAVVVDLGG
ncbi:hypothetical protein AB0A81_37765 [Streptomyces flaveolus]|uniref:Transposase n=1 Tax=Streptomyces flaveolus TaxID=67297 RepID=A0ABV1VJ37_9ACTN